MRQLGNAMLILLGLALLSWSTLAITGSDISWASSKFSSAGRERSEAMLGGLLGLALVGYATWNLVLGRKAALTSRSGRGKSSPEA
jgi:hypothetical protein